MTIKVCSKCSTEKPISEFSKCEQTKDGLRPECKQCRIKLQRKYYKTHRKQCLKQKADYYKSERGQCIINEYRQSQKAREEQRRSSKIAREKYPERIAAEHAVERAVKSGKLPKASTKKCIICNKQARDYHHNKGYTKEHWLDVIPVCRKCHTLIHNGHTL